MAYELFIDRFGQLGWKETRSATVLENNSYGLPADDYGLLEMYCNDENCDCRRVFFSIASRKQKGMIAVVAYGWESESFYKEWYGGRDVENSRIEAKEMTGLNLNLTSQQSKYAPAALELVRDILKDENYVARIKRHYKMFKDSIDGQPGQMPFPDEVPENPAKSNIAIEDVAPGSTLRKSRKRHHSRRSGS